MTDQLPDPAPTAPVPPAPIASAAPARAAVGPAVGASRQLTPLLAVGLVVLGAVLGGGGVLLGASSDDTKTVVVHDTVYAEPVDTTIDEAPCVMERRVVEVAIEAFYASEGRYPLSWNELVGAYIREPVDARWSVDYNTVPAVVTGIGECEGY